MSNWPNNSPTLENPSGNVEVKVLKNRFIAWEDLLQTDFITNNWISTFVDSITELIIGSEASNTKRSFRLIWNWITDSKISLSLKWFGWPSDNFIVRCETDNTGKPSWTLVNSNATWNVAWWSLSWSLTNEDINWDWSFTIPDWQIFHLVLQRSWSVSWTNYYVVWVETKTSRTFLNNIFNWTRWTANDNYTLYCSFNNIYTNVKVKTKADDEDLIIVDWVATTNVVIWTEFVADTIWTSDIFSWLEAKDYYLSNTAGQIGLTPWTNEVRVGRWVASDSLFLWGEWWSWGQTTYDAIIDANWWWNYTDIMTALAWPEKRYFIKSWTYTITWEVDLAWKGGWCIHWASDVIVNINDSRTTSSSWNAIFNCEVSSEDYTFEFKHFEIRYNLNYDSAFNWTNLFKLRGWADWYNVSLEMLRIKYIWNCWWTPNQDRAFNRFGWNNTDIITMRKCIWTMENWTNTDNSKEFYFQWSSDCNIVFKNCSFKINTSFTEIDDNEISFLNIWLKFCDIHSKNKWTWVEFWSYIQASWKCEWNYFRASRMEFYWDFSNNWFYCYSDFVRYDSDFIDWLENYTLWLEYTSYWVWSIIIKLWRIYICNTAHTSTDDWYDNDTKFTIKPPKYHINWWAFVNNIFSSDFNNWLYFTCIDDDDFNYEGDFYQKISLVWNKFSWWSQWFLRWWIQAMNNQIHTANYQTSIESQIIVDLFLWDFSHNILKAGWNNAHIDFGWERSQHNMNTWLVNNSSTYTYNNNTTNSNVLNNLSSVI